jgi:hypothetical protein
MKSSRDKTELADIILCFGDDYIKRHRVSYHQHKVMEAIKNCRTSVMGGHKNECDHCGHEDISYNSCRNRHCPKCGQIKQLQWADKLASSLMPIRYFHIVFTLPHELAEIVLTNQQECYNILFKTSVESLQQAALNPEYLGAETGCIAVLHTWGQNLNFHPHIHMIVPAGGLTVDGIEWKHSSRKFFVPVKALAKMFRAKYLEKIKYAYDKGQLQLPVQTDLEELIGMLKKKNWNVHSELSFRGPRQVINYLGRYATRVAITNNRIISCESGKVTFRWKNYRNNGRWEKMELDADEFLGRFLLHILPDGYYKIRYFGILASANSKTKKKQCFLLLEATPAIPEYDQMSWDQIWQKAIGVDLLLCPICKQGRMIRKTKIDTHRLN